ncbi:putative hydrolase [Candidatus Terasakiella magnetica]|uniref:Putative hydrolase n=1 Tax=Candidatus Terasakiella magnetica TaxID=1867952 RepID=A0A1C3REU4_9PROT|nr:acyl-CoA thioesterase [Candidatus Terasakiella magnetica]SCA55781.1 putative hydrolase [Candidatus Terasakiella magnetica]
MSKQEVGPSGKPAIRTLAMPGDANPNGDIFGGWVMSQMDIAGGVTAAWRAQGRVATVGVEAMSFLKPVSVGDVVCVYTDIVREGNTSMAIMVELWVLRQSGLIREKVTEGIFTFVAIDDNGTKRSLPPVPDASLSLS